MSSIHCIGVDFSTDIQKVGLALARISDADIRLVDLSLGSAALRPENVVNDWLSNHDVRLIGIDAPLGWPTALSVALNDHVAGVGLDAIANAMFSRRTDHSIYARFKKRPLEVGANLIASTAHDALRFLSDVRAKAGKRLPVAWKTGVPDEPSVVEVYPAATIRAFHIPFVNYKGTKGVLERQSLVREICKSIIVPTVFEEVMVRSDDAVDAVICSISAFDFLMGRSTGPSCEELSEAVKEGWIWVRDKASSK
jgi:hypothetical protein